MTILRKGKVLYKNILAGFIEETEDEYRFIYDDVYLSQPTAHPLSVSLPLQSHPHISSTLHPFFDGLIPQGWLLAIVTKNWKIDARERMGLLLTVCRDCIGAVSVEGINE